MFQKLISKINARVNLKNLSFQRAFFTLKFLSVYYAVIGAFLGGGLFPPTSLKNLKLVDPWKNFMWTGRIFDSAKSNLGLMFLKNQSNNKKR